MGGGICITHNVDSDQWKNTWGKESDIMPLYFSYFDHSALKFFIRKNILVTKLKCGCKRNG